MRLLCLLFVLAVPGWGQPSPKSVTISGSVVGPDGKLVPGAEVSVQNGSTLHADIAGRFIAQMHPWPTSPGVLGRIAARSPQGLGGVLVQGTAPVTVRLQHFVTVSGRVINPQGAPVRGARVCLSLTNGLGSDVVRLEETPWQDSYATRSDAQGRWTLYQVPAPGQVVFELQDPRFVATLVWKKVTASTHDGPTLVAQPGGTVEGRVVFADGRPASHIPILVAGHRPNGGGGAAVTNPAGKFEVSGLPPGRCNVMVFDHERQWVANAIQGALVKPGKTIPLGDLVLSRGVVLRGRVVDSSTEAGVGKVLVASFGPQNPRSSTLCVPSTTDSTGRFQFRLPPGETLLYVKRLAKGYQVEPLSRTIIVQPGNHDELVFKVSRQKQSIGQGSTTRSPDVRVWVAKRITMPLAGLVLMLLVWQVTKLARRSGGGELSRGGGMTRSD